MTAPHITGMEPWRPREPADWTAEDGDAGLPPPLFRSVRADPIYGASVSVCREAKQAAARNKFDREKVRIWCAVYTAIALRACK